MPIVNGADLLALLRQCRLLDSQQVHELEAQLASYPEPRSLARELVQRGWLTPLQVNELFLDRGPKLLLGSYVLLEKLGEGGMGAVYKARNWKLGTIVAVKIIRRDRLANANAVRRFQREIRAAARLNHANIVRALDADEIEGTHLLVMEFVDGIDLHKLVKTRGPLPLRMACDYIRQAALGLQHAFEQGFVHRDIKPHNLLVSGEWRVASGEQSTLSSLATHHPPLVKILDMGLALAESPLADDRSSTMTQEGTVMGTPDYMAPEQSRDAHDVDIRADLYSLGCTLYYLLTGRPPFVGGTFAEKLLMHQFDEPAPVSCWRPGAPRELTALVGKLLSKRREDRCQTPLGLAQLLAAMHERLPEPAAETSDSGSTVAPRKTAASFPSLDTSLPAVKEFRQRQSQETWQLRSWLIGGSGFLALLLALFVWSLFSGKKPHEPPEQTDRRQIKRKPKDAEPAAKKEPDVLSRPGPVSEEWMKAVRLLPPQEQARAVVAKLKALNAGFDDTKVMSPDIQEDKVTGIAFNQPITDISPVRALVSLEKLVAQAEQYAHYNPRPILSLADLSPLKALPLKHLELGGHRLGDLSPLAGMPLEHASFYHSLVEDLSPLTKCSRLAHLDISSTMVRDLGPLKGLPLRILQVNNTFVEDLTPLIGMPLEHLNLRFTAVRDLSPLRGMKSLTDLRLGGTLVTDISPLKGLRFQRLQLEGTPPWPLSQLKDNDIGATYLDCSIRTEKDVAALQGLPAQPLSINNQDVTQFWKVMRPGPEHTAFLKEVEKLSPAAQVKAVCARLGKLNGVTPQADFKEADHVVVGLRIVGPRDKPVDPKAYRLTDLTPLEALPGLRSLEIDSEGGIPYMDNFWPLRRMALEKLHTQASVVDLSPLANMPLRSLRPFPGHGSLSALANCPLEGLELGLSAPITDLGPLRKMPLKSASFPAYIVKDLEALREAPLKAITMHYVEPRHRQALKAMKQLETINGKPVGAFWQDIALQQLEFVRRELKRLNPGFAGKVERSLQDNEVYSLKIIDDELVDLSPLVHLKGLKVLFVGPKRYPGLGKLSDLSPLAPLSLTHLAIHRYPVSDLSPCARMPLISVVLISTDVKDISCLRGMPMQEVNIMGSPVADLGPLRDTKLTTFAGDRTSIRDYRVLADMPLGDVTLDFNYYRDADWLRKMTTLKKINSLPTADFWAKVEARQAEFDAWCAKVAKLPAREQIQEVLRQLKNRNPEFDEKTRDEPVIENGEVVDFSIWTLQVGDIEPVRALKRLRRLSLTGDSDAAGKVVNLWPLRDIRLDYLNVSGNRHVDLTALKGMVIGELAVGYLPIADLSALDGIELEGLGLQATHPFSDLSPLKGRKLKRLHLRITAVKDIEPLRGMPLEYLYLPAGVTNLEPIRGMPLEELHLGDMPAKNLTDLSVIASLPKLTTLDCEFIPWRDSTLLRSLKNIETINLKKDLKEFHAWADWEDAVRAAGPQKRFEMVKTRMMELNPKLPANWGARYTLRAGQFDELNFQGDLYTDIAPLRAIGEMPTLLLGRGIGHGPAQRCLLTDISPLRGLKISHLSLHNCDVADLRPLEGMSLDGIRLTGTKVRDLSPLLETKLKQIDCDFVAGRDTPILRRIKTLATINGKNTAEVLK